MMEPLPHERPVLIGRSAKSRERTFCRVARTCRVRSPHPGWREPSINVSAIRILVTRRKRARHVGALRAPLIVASGYGQQSLTRIVSALARRTSPPSMFGRVAGARGSATKARLPGPNFSIRQAHCVSDGSCLLIGRRLRIRRLIPFVHIDSAVSDACPRYTADRWEFPHQLEVSCETDDRRQLLTRWMAWRVSTADGR
jgi:hypothetical protein